MRDGLLTAVAIAGAIAAVSLTPAALAGQAPKAAAAPTARAEPRFPARLTASRI